MVWAQRFSVNGIAYNVTSTEKLTVEVTGAELNWDIVIPAAVQYNGKTYSVKSIGGWAFFGCSELTSVTIPNSVTAIGTGAFNGCSSLASLTIPNSVTTIGDYAFNSCSELTSVTIPKSVTNIGGRAFTYCSGLAYIVVEAGNSVYDSREACNAIIKTNDNELMAGCRNSTIPNSVTAIGAGAFEGCSSLTSVTIGSSVRSIGEQAFANCDKLKTVSCLAENVPSTESDVFQFSHIENATLFVPETSLDAYKATAPWSQFGTIEITDAASVRPLTYDAPMLVISNGGQLTIKGAADGTQVRVYSMNGVETGSSISRNGLAMVSTNLQPGTAAIIKIGKRSVKVAMK